MYKQGQILRTSADLDNAVLFALPVEVWWRGELIDEGGHICEHTSLSVSMGDRYYPRTKCEFRVK